MRKYNLGGFKMAASKLSQGFKCEFVDSVPEDFYCKECTLVARGLVMTDCCGESYCHGCITHSLQQGLPCPACGEQNFTIFHQNKYRKRINALKVYCRWKERGCVWYGTLDHLNIHLDPELDNCQYVDTKCPLNCPLSVPRNMVDQHVAQQCARRPHVCHHCGFKAPYQELVDTHLPQCKYVPLTCPNRCGVTCERDFLEDHMKMCRLEEIHCDFRGVGCDGRFLREDEDEHIRENSHKHLTLTASLAVHSKEQLLQKLLEQDKKHKEVEAEMKEKLQQKEKIIEQQEKKTKQQERKLVQQDNKLELHEKRIQQLEKVLEKIKGEQNKAEQQHKALDHKLNLQHNVHKQEEKNLQHLQNQIHKLSEQEKGLKLKLAEQEHTLLEKIKHLQQRIKTLENSSQEMKEKIQERHVSRRQRRIPLYQEMKRQKKEQDKDSLKTKPTSKPRAKTIYDYSAEGEDEISFDVDEIITDIDQIDSGWWRGTRLKNGAYGLFPANYVELL